MKPIQCDNTESGYLHLGLCLRMAEQVRKDRAYYTNVHWISYDRV